MELDVTVLFKISKLSDSLCGQALPDSTLDASLQSAKSLFPSCSLVWIRVDLYLTCSLFVLQLLETLASGCQEELSLIKSSDFTVYQQPKI